MHSVSNLMKLNAMNNEKLSYEKMNIQELKMQLKKFQNLQNNVKLINSLKDKGQKINDTLKIIEDLIKKRAENKENASEITEVENLVDQLEILKVDKLKSDEAKIESEADLTKTENYFSKITKATSNNKPKKEIDENKLEEIKKKIKEKNDKRSKYKESKEIPIDEAFKLLKEHEKRTQEYQMKQAAERLLMGQSVKYELSFMDKTEKKNLAYRDANKENEFDEDEFYENENDESENEDYYDEEEYSSSSGIDKVHNSERLKYKHYSDDLEKVD